MVLSQIITGVGTEGTRGPSPLDYIPSPWELAFYHTNPPSVAPQTRVTVDTLHWCHMPCFSHTIQLAVHVAMKLQAVSRATACYKHLINHFHHSVQSTQIL